MNMLKVNVKEDKPFTLKDLGVRQYAILGDGPPNCADYVGQVVFIHDHDEDAALLFTASNLLGFTILNEDLDRYIVRPLEPGESFTVIINEG